MRVIRYDYTVFCYSEIAGSSSLTSHGSGGVLSVEAVMPQLCNPGSQPRLVHTDAQETWDQGGKG